MPAKPQLSIGLPVYNGEEHLSQALDSILAQQWGDFELIISDNASTDATPQICRDYAAKDKRIKYHRSLTNQGLVWNFNNVFNLGSGEFFMMAAHDDYWHPRYLQSCLEILKGSSSVVLVGSMCDCMDSRMSAKLFTDFGVGTAGLAAQRRFRDYKIYCGNTGINSMFYGVYRREALAKVMPFKKVFGFDYIALNGLSLLGEFVMVQETLMKKRGGGESVDMQRAARSVPITNFLLIRYPNLIREINLQATILKSGQLGALNKTALASWSLCDFFRSSFLNRTKFLHESIDPQPA